MSDQAKYHQPIPVETQFDKVPPNLTTQTVAEKNKAPLPAQINKAFDVINSSVDTLNGIQVPDLHKTAKLANVAEREFRRASDDLDAYEAKLQAAEVSFYQNIDSLSKPRDTTEAIQQSGWQAAMVQGGKESARMLARSDETLAKAALQLPLGLARTVGLENRDILKEKIFPGYVGEMKRYSLLLENAQTARAYLNQKIGPLFRSHKARKAVSDIQLLRDL
jgi:hypothetical protein